MATADIRRNQLVADLEEVAGGDRRALRRVYDATSAKLFGICLRIVRDRQVAEDVLQEVYVKVWHRAGRFDATRASPITWLSVLARNSAIDWSRSVDRRREVDDDGLEAMADDGVPADLALEQQQEMATVHRCLDALEGPAKSAIRAAFFDGLTYVQLAEAQDVPLGTMKSWIRRGLERMRKCIDHG